MAAIEGGTFELGYRDVSALTPHTVSLAGYCIDKFEVTVKQFQEWRRWTGQGDACPADPTFPVRCISIEEARDYCVAHDKHLVTSDEWEAAAGGRERRRNPWGNSPGSTITMSHLHPVGTNAIDRTPEGVFDMGGNVPEFTESDACSHYLLNGPPYTLVRGGTVLEDGDPLTSEATCRSHDTPAAGFRCAAPLRIRKEGGIP
jgi:formylglycine-generating enzyme required for sulfatase activity